MANLPFTRFVGIDYSGAEYPEASLKGLRVYQAAVDSSPTEVLPPPSARKYWSRKGLAQWLMDELRDGPPTIVGIDHAFSFPLPYFERHGIPRDWDTFLDDFCLHWPTDGDNMYVDFALDPRHGNGTARQGDSRWKRLTEKMTCTAKSVFQFGVPGQVANSTHAGLPWLRRIRREFGDAVHFWPFDGWDVPPGRHLIVEVYPALWKKAYPVDDRTPDQHDAYAVCRWLQERSREGKLGEYLQIDLPDAERDTARVEGWILGVKDGVETRPSRKQSEGGSRKPRREIV